METRIDLLIIQSTLSSRVNLQRSKIKIYLSMSDSETKVGNNTSAVAANKNILCLDVPVRNGWLALQ